jgi:hypothetical protein
MKQAAAASAHCGAWEGWVIVVEKAGTEKDMDSSVSSHPQASTSIDIFAT